MSFQIRILEPTGNVKSTDTVCISLHENSHRRCTIITPLTPSSGAKLVIQHWITVLCVGCILKLHGLLYVHGISRLCEMLAWFVLADTNFCNNVMWSVKEWNKNYFCWLLSNVLMVLWSSGYCKRLDADHSGWEGREVVGGKSLWGVTALSEHTMFDLWRDVTTWRSFINHESWGRLCRCTS